MILHQLKLIFGLKRTIWYRYIREIPVMYLILLGVFALSAGWALWLANIPITWKSLSVSVILQWFICTRLKYRNNKKELMNQYPALYPVSLLTDTLFSTLPFLLAHIYFWLIAVAVSGLYVLLSTRVNEGLQIKQLTIPSPFFSKSAFLWHSQFRVFLPAVWLFIVVIAVIAHIHNNFNLAIAIYCIGIFFSVSTIILQKEEADFVSIYLNGAHFRKRTTSETLASTTIFALPLAFLLLLLFPAQWQIIALSLVCILLIGVNLLWIKYIFYPSMLLAALFFFVGAAIQAALTISSYGLALIPFYYLGFYYLFRRKTNNYFIGNERIDY